jgi:tRNA G18 (ribose-2'-O)-methylase SpoU
MRGKGFDDPPVPLHTAFHMNDLKNRLAWERRLERRKRRRAEYRRGLRPFAIASWNTTKEHNIGSLVRTAHAVAAAEVVLVGDREWNVEAARTAELYTTVTQVPGLEAFREHLAVGRWNLVAVELDPRAVNLFEAEYPERPCFLLGAEVGGVPEALLAQARLIVQIPQWGLVPSLNVAVAGSIVVYDYLAKQRRMGRLARPQGGLFEPTGDEAVED